MKILLTLFRFVTWLTSVSIAPRFNLKETDSMRITNVVCVRYQNNKIMHAMGTSFHASKATAQLISFSRPFIS
jgi:hypothetical protein